jgi:hypothetical protein
MREGERETETDRQTDHIYINRIMNVCYIYNIFIYVSIFYLRACL